MAKQTRLNRAFKVALATSFAVVATACSAGSGADSASISGTDSEGNQVMLWLYLKPNQKDSAGNVEKDPRQCWYSAKIPKASTDVVAASKKEAPTVGEMELLYPALAGSKVLNLNGLSARTTEYAKTFKGALEIVNKAVELDPNLKAAPAADHTATAPATVEKPKTVSAAQQLLNESITKILQGGVEAPLTDLVKTTLADVGQRAGHNLTSGNGKKNSFFGNLLGQVANIGLGVLGAGATGALEAAQNKSKDPFAKAGLGILASGARSFLGGLIGGGTAALTSLDGGVDANAAYLKEIEKARINGTNLDQNIVLSDTANLEQLIKILSTVDSKGNEACADPKQVVADAKAASAKIAADKAAAEKASPVANPGTAIDAKGIAPKAADAGVYLDEKSSFEGTFCKMPAAFKATLQASVDLSGSADGKRIPVKFEVTTANQDALRTGGCPTLASFLPVNGGQIFYIDAREWNPSN